MRRNLNSSSALYLARMYSTTLRFDCGAFVTRLAVSFRINSGVLLTGHAAFQVSHEFQVLRWVGFLEAV